MDIRLEWNPRQLGFFTSRKIENAVKRAIKKAGGDAIRKVRTESTRYVRSKKKLKVGFIQKRLRLVFPRSNDLADLRWDMRISGKPIPLSAYPSRQTSKGVSVHVNATGSRKVVKGAFLATMKSGHKGVYSRMGKKRLPIEEHFSSSIAHVFNNAEAMPRIHTHGQRVLQSAFERLLPLELAKGK